MSKHPIFKQKKTLGQRSSDILTTFVGSWTFIISLLVLMGVWMVLNAMAWFFAWDPYPFILLNFVLSTLAAIQAPIILMSQNRQGERDRLQAKYDYNVDKKSEREIQNIQRDLDSIKKLLKEKL